VTIWVTSSVVECLYQGKKISWARVFEEVIDQQVRLLGPNNLSISLPGYLARLYLAKDVLSRREKTAYWLTQRAGNPDEKKKAAVDPRAETNPEGKEEPEEEEAQDGEEEVDVERSPSAEEHTPSPQQQREEVVRFILSTEKAQKVIPDLEPAPSTSKRLPPEEQRLSHFRWIRQAILICQMIGTFQSYPGRRC
jgi:hypothetical protein